MLESIKQTACGTARLLYLGDRVVRERPHPEPAHKLDVE